MTTKFTQAISDRYDLLSGQDCCLSCGGAINYAEIKPGDVCADLGSGKGFDVLKMATKAGNEGFAYGIDVSVDMMEIARSNAQKLSQNNVEFVRSELESINLPNEKLDVLLSNCTINHSLQQDKVWKEIFRVMKKGGTFVVSDIYAVEPIPEQYRNDPQAVAECWAGAVVKQDYLDNIKNAGFTHVEFIEESNPYDKGKTKVCSFTMKGKK